MTSHPDHVIHAVEDIVQAHQHEINVAVINGILEAASRCAADHPGDPDTVKDMLRKSVLDDRAMAQITRSLITTMSKQGTRVAQTDWNLEEYEPHLDKDTADKIKSGELDLIDICHSDIGRRKVDSSYTEPGSCAYETQISATRLAPFSAKIINGVLCGNRTNSLASKSTGDNTKYVNMMDLLDFACMFKSTNEFSLPSALVTLNTSGRKTQEAKSYLFPDHMDNRVGGRENLQTSGSAFLGAVRLTDAWNKLVYLHYGSPKEGSPEYDSYLKDSITEADVKQTLAALTMVCKHQPEQTEKLMKLGYGHVSDSQVVKNVDKQLLVQHINTMRTPEEKARRLALYESMKQPKAEGGKYMKKPEGIPKVRLTAVELYQFAHPEDQDTLLSVGKPLTVPEKTTMFRASKPSRANASNRSADWAVQTRRWRPAKNKPNKDTL